MSRPERIDTLRFAPLNPATQCPNPDGMDTHGPAWRAWCEAWAVYHRLTTPDKRRAYLLAVKTARGADSCQALEALILAIHRGAARPP